ncbi:MAG: hypothetical protein J6W44_00595, partial [Oscillospiraceae bacterium]|nr:hypothetical protein [Oscillospiraceae bacterium]
GGSLFAAGNSYRLKRFSPDNGQIFLCTELSEAAEGQISVCMQDGTVLDTLDLNVPAKTVHFSSPAIKPGENYELHSGNSTVFVAVG